MSTTRTDTRRADKRKAASPRRTAARPPTGPARASARSRAAAAARSRAPRIPFVLLVLCLLGGALVGLLVLRGVIAQEAFAISNLQTENRELSYDEQRLRGSVAHLETSGRISDEAEALGMEQGDAPLFIDPGSGRVTGGAQDAADGGSED
ncbi:hypothetical protein ACFVWN_03515 [Nocardiopsis flavescens]|uniref:Cell division protein FtsL n=1 Tax=Nocardiopsis flavescens TaxID=758803 RepID=A0A1M6ETW2_9ACTN|nr:hypothetical protein [Nocardiopsis flavescens]SHI88964.1 hypothetical protein SAMN05421803_102409 [Nocardiopsis flavescens]